MLQNLCRASSVPCPPASPLAPAPLLTLPLVDENIGQDPGHAGRHLFKRASRAKRAKCQRCAPLCALAARRRRRLPWGGLLAGRRRLLPLLLLVPLLLYLLCLLRLLGLFHGSQPAAQEVHLCSRSRLPAPALLKQLPGSCQLPPLLLSLHFEVPQPRRLRRQLLRRCIHARQRGGS